MLKKLRVFLTEKRILISRIFSVLLFILILISKDRWEENGFMDLTLAFLGVILVSIGMLGRIWVSMYVSGYKSSSLIIEGPYSIVRNPLYFFSFLGAAGIGMSSGSLLVTSLICVGFILYYPFVIVQEEKQLAAKHGADFLKYTSVTPRLIPDPFRYHQPVSYTVAVKQYQKSFVDAGMFILIYAFVQLLERLHESGVLPVYLRIP